MKEETKARQFPDCFEVSEKKKTGYCECFYHVKPWSNHIFAFLTWQTLYLILETSDWLTQLNSQSEVSNIQKAKILI